MAPCVCFGFGGPKDIFSGPSGGEGGRGVVRKGGPLIIRLSSSKKWRLSVKKDSLDRPVRVK